MRAGFERVDDLDAVIRQPDRDGAVEADIRQRVARPPVQRGEAESGVRIGIAYRHQTRNRPRS